MSSGLSETSTDHPRTSSFEEECSSEGQPRLAAVSCQLFSQVLNNTGVSWKIPESPQTSTQIVLSGFEVSYMFSFNLSVNNISLCGNIYCFSVLDCSCDFSYWSAFCYNEIELLYRLLNMYHLEVLEQKQQHKQYNKREK